MEDKLPKEIKSYLPDGYNDGLGTWLVLPAESDSELKGIADLNAWLREQEWCPNELSDIIWFGDDGVGNMLGWEAKSSKAVIWHPADGAECWHKDTLNNVWAFVKSDYE